MLASRPVDPVGEAAISQAFHFGEVASAQTEGSLFPGPFSVLEPIGNGDLAQGRSTQGS